MTRTADSVNNLPLINPVTTDGLDLIFVDAFVAISSQTSRLATLSYVHPTGITSTLWRNTSYIWLGVPSAYGTPSSHLIPKDCVENNSVGSSGIQVCANNGTSRYVAVIYSADPNEYGRSIEPISSNGGANTFGAVLGLFGNYFVPDRANDYFCKSVMAFPAMLGEIDPPYPMIYYANVPNHIDIVNCDMNHPDPCGLVGNKICSDFEATNPWESVDVGTNLYVCAVGLSGRLIGGRTYRLRSVVESCTASNATAEFVIQEIHNDDMYLYSTNTYSVDLSSTNTVTFVAQNNCYYMIHMVIKSTIASAAHSSDVFRFLATIDPWIEEVVM